MRVLLLEAGGSPSALHDVPLLAAEFQKTRVDWQYKTVPQDAACFGLNNRVPTGPFFFFLYLRCVINSHTACFSTKSLYYKKKNHFF